MAYKTIVTYFTSPIRADALIESAIAVAQRFDAHVIGLYVVPPVEIYVAAEVPITADIADVQRRHYTEEAEQIQASFEKAFNDAGVSSEWRVADATGSTVPETIMAHARCADLTIASQDQGLEEYGSRHKVAEEVMFAGGRPVLFIPTAGSYPKIGDHVTVAWDGSREAARACFDALPFLKEAKDVKILSVNPDETAMSGANLPGSELANSLSRHDVRCEASHTTTDGISVADELLSRLSDQGSDLLVIGGFGHSRVRELVFGGVTRHILAHMTSPVLMVH